MGAPQAWASTPLPTTPLLPKPTLRRDALRSFMQEKKSDGLMRCHQITHKVHSVYQPSHHVCLMDGDGGGWYPLSWLEKMFTATQDELATAVSLGDWIVRSLIGLEKNMDKEHMLQQCTNSPLPYDSVPFPYLLQVAKATAEPETCRDCPSSLCIIWLHDSSNGTQDGTQ